MNIQNLVVSLLGIAIIGGVGIKAVKVIEQNNSYISVKGLADRNVVADSAIWTISLSEDADTVKEAQEKLKKEFDTVKKFIKDLGIRDDEITGTDFETQDKFYWGIPNVEPKVKRYHMTIKISIKTNEINKTKTIRSKLTSLHEQNIDVSDSIKYIYTKIDKLRIEMLQDAAKDSEKRAFKVAEALGAKITGLRNFASGKFSMTAEDESITSDNQWQEEKSINKRIRVVVTSSFNLKKN